MKVGLGWEVLGGATAQRQPTAGKAQDGSGTMQPEACDCPQAASAGMPATFRMRLLLTWNSSWELDISSSAVMMPRCFSSPASTPGGMGGSAAGSGSGGGGG